LALALLGTVPFLIGVGVLQCRKLLALVQNEDNKRQTLVASLLLCFGAGVLLSTSLLHILPESRAGLLNAQENLGIECFAELLFSSGFFLVYFIEDLLLVILQQKNNHEHRPINVPESHLERSSKHLTPKSSTSALRNFVTALALSAHSLFEGLAVGVEESKKDVWALFIAIALHKCVIGFCMSLELVQSGTRLVFFFSYMAAFCLVSPIGIGIGMGVSEMSNIESRELIVSVLQALSGGTILYLVMFEIIQRERQKKVPKLLQLFAVLVGFAGMLTVDILFDHDHEHQENGEL